ncbi:potassium/proton antiporter [Phycicoccus duodecadis]|uniref:Potassium/proton antiporter (CPA1 family) n=1 Tax=Phycicoccus duodecadis TaxID=173053 RepID=A0A2N3YKX0_9MICO|nr:potassium/proton antiporter [Phycicoccus duodecadis]PKW27500.1 potassium/proton antiporter (CPA1 family) [Phycicoccus duodecadis]
MTLPWALAGSAGVPGTDGAPGAGGASGPFTADDLSLALLVGSVVLVVAVAAVRLSVRSGLPSLLIYLGIGLALGESGLGIRYDSQELTQVLGYAALVLILVEGGISTQWAGIRRSVAPAAVLATVGVAVSVVVVAVVARLVLGWSWEVSLLIGAVVASTDAAAVFSVLRRVPLPRRISGMLEAESGFNDAPTVLLVTALASQLAPDGEGEPWWQVGIVAGLELAGGALVGLAVGWLGARLLRAVATTSSALFAIGVLSMAVLAYGAADLLHTSGFIACYLAALVLGNVSLPHRPSVMGFATAIGWLAQIGLFVLLGLLASPSGFAAQLVPALVVGAAVLLLGRPLSVIASCTPFRIPWRTQAFLSWAGLRGAVPIVLATVPVTAGTPGVEWMFDLVFVLVVVFTLIQAPTLPWVARALKVDAAHHRVDLAVEATPLTELGAELLEIDIGAASRLAGVRVFELRLPRGANVALVVRGGGSFVPRDVDVLRHGDQLLVVAPSAVRPAVERRLYQVSRGGRLAEWTAD